MKIDKEQRNVSLYPLNASEKRNINGKVGDKDGDCMISTCG